MLIIFPFVDILSSFNNRFGLLPFSPGVIIRGIVLVYVIIYIFFNKDINKEKRKKYIKYFILLLSFTIIFFINRILNGIDIKSLVLEVISFSKYWYFPITILFMNSYKFDNKKLTLALKISTILYTSGIIIPMLTHTSFKSYITDYHGIIGWFYSANEIGGLLSINLVLLYLNLKNNNEKIYVFLILLNNYCLTLLGTKVSLFALVIVAVLTLILFIITKGLKSKEAKYASFILVASLLIIIFSSTSYDVLRRLNINIPFLMKEEPKQEVRLLSGRDDLLSHAYLEYKNTSVQNKLFGMGFLENSKYRIVEMDMFDILFGYGIIGLIIYFIPLIYYFLAVLKRYIKLTLHNLICFMGVGLLLSIAFISGHTLSAPSVSFYVSMCLGLIKKQSSTN